MYQFPKLRLTELDFKTWTNYMTAMSNFLSHHLATYHHKIVARKHIPLRVFLSSRNFSASICMYFVKRNSFLVTPRNGQVRALYALIFTTTL